MRVLIRILRWALLVALILLLAVGGGGYLWLRGSLPQTTGTITVAGLNAPIEIVRDSDAVPHIRAQSEADALFGLGYVHAQDRLWQMEFQRRVGNGRIAEFAGPSQLSTDTFLRTLDASRFMQPVGQSGQVMSRNYSNLIERWQRVDYLPMRFEQTRIEQAAEDRLVLEPH